MGTRAGEGRGTLSVGVDPVGAGPGEATEGGQRAPDYRPLMTPQQATNFMTLLQEMIISEIRPTSTMGKSEIRMRMRRLLLGRG